MQYHAYTPSPPLSHFIERFWACSDVPAHARERILPSGTIELVVNLQDDEIRIGDSLAGERVARYSGAVVSGAYERFFVIDPQQHASILGVHFRPGGAAPFLTIPPGEITGRHVTLDECWGRGGRELRERLCAAPTVRERFAILEQVLLQRLLLRPLHPSVATALHAFREATTVKEVVREVGLSHRRFAQLFTSAVGLTPKLFQRVTRFQHARGLARASAAPDWPAIALACGYFDQAHLHRDFLAFSGFAPAACLRRHSERVLPNHIPQVA
ncbi:MAG TPA: AraC family transcriptional regulator [Thermoanaerobaculia bacterium]